MLIQQNPPWTFWEKLGHPLYLARCVQIFTHHLVERLPLDCSLAWGLFQPNTFLFPLWEDLKVLADQVQKKRWDLYTVSAQIAGRPGFANPLIKADWSQSGGAEVPL